MSGTSLHLRRAQAPLQFKPVTPGRDEVANPGSISPRAPARWIPGSAFGGPGMTAQEAWAIARPAEERAPQ